MLRTTGLCAAALAALFIAGSAQAAVVTQTYAFTLGDFVDTVSPANAAPISSITGSFTVTFDTDFELHDGTSVTVNSLNGVTVDSPIGYTFWPAGGGYPAFLSIGGLADGAEFINAGNDFTLSLKFTDPSHPHLALCSDGYDCGLATGSLASGYTVQGLPDHYFVANSGGVSVPEPAAWALMLLGFGLSGAALRSRKALCA
jgi:hypothetical protein